MKILLAIDGSNCSNVAVRNAARRPWPAESKLKIITVMESPFAPALNSGEFDADFRESAEKAARHRAQVLIDKAVETLLALSDNKELKITAKILEGTPIDAILAESEQWDADLIIVGSHGYRDSERLLLGSVSQVVSMHAKCSVEIVRDKKTRPPEAPALDSAGVKA